MPARTHSMGWSMPCATTLYSGPSAAGHLLHIGGKQLDHAVAVLRRVHDADLEVAVLVDDGAAHWLDAGREIAQLGHQRRAVAHGFRNARLDADGGLGGVGPLAAHQLQRRRIELQGQHQVVVADHRELDGLVLGRRGEHRPQGGGDFIGTGLRIARVIAHLHGEQDEVARPLEAGTRHRRALLAHARHHDFLE